MTAQERAAHQLVTGGALVQLSLADAREVVRYMQPRRVAGRDGDLPMPVKPPTWITCCWSSTAM
jgi:hypothetical protein